MADDEWFRQKSWNDAIASAFNVKLQRARRKSQYLRIQASTLAQTQPLVALELLDRYFSLDDDFDHAQAHVDRATAYLAIGKLESAVQSYEAALQREAEFPKLRTGAYLDLPYLIALQGLSQRYEQAIALLSSSEDQLMFPVDHFKFHAAKAIIHLAQGNKSDARAEARLALEAASQEQSGFRYHSGVGLVSDRHRQAISKLRGLCDA